MTEWTTPHTKQKDILIISGDCLGSNPEHKNVDLLWLGLGRSSCLLIKPASLTRFEWR